MLRKILVLTVHPGLNRSVVTRAVWDQLIALPGIECCDLYELYPDFYINVAMEQQRLMEADLVVFLHPIFWYSAPSLLKEWQIRVLTNGFAYGKNGSALRGKDLWQVVSAGGPAEKYTPDGRLGCSMIDILKPYEAMARKCLMHWHPPKVLYRAHNVSTDQVNEYAREVLRHLLDYQSIGNTALQANH